MVAQVLDFYLDIFAELSNRIADEATSSVHLRGKVGAEREENKVE